MRSRFVTRLSLRQALSTMLVAVILSISATIGEQLVYVEQERKAIQRQTEEVLGLVAATAAKAAYVLDSDLADEVLSGLLSYTSIYEARLIDDFGNVLATGSRPRASSNSRWLSELAFGAEVRISRPLRFSSSRRVDPIQVGALTVVVDPHSVAVRFLDQSLLSIATGFASNLCLGIVLLLLFQRMVTRPIMMISRDLAKVRPEDPSAHRLAAPEGHEGTEIGFLVQHTNELLGRYDSTLKQRDTFMSDLIAARQRAEEASRAKSQFLTTISHELRTPLNAIIGFSQIIRDDLASSDKNQVYADFAGEIYNSGQHLLNVINDIIDFSSIETGRMDASPEPVELRPVFESCVRLNAARMEASGLSFLTDIAPGTPYVFADPRAIKQILVHLLSNAMKFTVVGGTISLAARGSANGVEISVIDTGIGIDKADLGKIFQPFWQAAPVLSRHHEGTGLGLTMVKSLVELNGGRITVDSTPSHGTRFTVTLPAYIARPVDTAPPVRDVAGMLSTPQNPAVS